ncbi:MAG: hypothetical protein J3K34DRAFT_410757 [Monoraphidium minutum]|nr:MAG: hypothetical protein J3K34DRAFT_410757 [Monoraphidium minutum]
MQKIFLLALRVTPCRSGAGEQIARLPTHHPTYSCVGGCVCCPPYGTQTSLSFVRLSPAAHSSCAYVFGGFYTPS